MKKNIILASSLFITFIVLVLLVHFFASDLTFKEKMFVYGENGVTFETDEWLYEDYGEEFDFYYTNFTNSVMVSLTIEEKDYLNDLELHLDLKDYAELIYGYGAYINNEMKLSDKGYYYFTYKDEDEEYFYMAALYESENYFYLMDFGCNIEYKEKYEKKFLKWADSVEIEE